jgi:predicted N-formylglutamate amidohydrolase
MARRRTTTPSRLFQLLSDRDVVMQVAPSASSPPLLGPGDPPPVEICHDQGAAPVLLTCDHASNAIPRVLDGLGLPPAALTKHIAWDVGAAAVTRLLAEALGAPALLAGYSRLVVDCNRDPGDPTSIPAVSDGVAVPGNRDLTEEARAARLAACFAPYHAAIAARLDALLAGMPPALLSIHSFTPVMAGVARPWHVGILWDKDGRIPEPLLAALRADPAIAVGDNQPYSAREPAGYTVRHHAVRRGLPNVAIELRQDLVADAKGARSWAERLATALRPILARREIYRVEPATAAPGNRHPASPH